MDSYYGYFAQAYGAGTYSGCSYNNSTSCSTSSSGSGSGGSLTNTGFLIAVILTVACLIIFASLLIRWYKRNRKPAVENVADTTEVEPEDDDLNNQQNA